MKTHWLKSPDGLVPADAETEEAHAKWPRDSLISVETKRLRNGAMHRKFFALINLVWETAPEAVGTNYPTCELFLSALKISAGHCQTVWARSPHYNDQYIPCHIPKSISFAKMDQDEFNHFYDQVCNVILRDFWPGMDKETLQAEVAEMCGAGGFSELDRMPDSGAR